MGKLKDALIGAQETAALSGANEALLWQAQAALSAALYNLGEPDEGLASAEHALQLLMGPGHIDGRIYQAVRQSKQFTGGSIRWRQRRNGRAI